VRYEAELYGAGAHELIERLHAVPEDVGSVMLIGHNPGFEDLVLALAGPAALQDKFPTAALATLAVPAWSEVAPGSGELLDLVRPRELA
jgi:phosphohistidine phosphatase